MPAHVRQDAEVAAPHGLARSYTRMVREKRADDLDGSRVGGRRRHAPQPALGPSWGGADLAASAPHEPRTPVVRLYQARRRQGAYPRSLRPGHATTPDVNRLALLSSAALLSWAGPASAQPELGLDLGAVAPVAELSEHRTVSVSAVLSAGFGTERRRWSSRAEVGYQRIFGPAPPHYATGSRQHDDVDLLSARASLIRTFGRQRGRAVYGLLGVGAYALRVRGDDGVGAGPGAHLGVGVRFPAGGSTVSVEAQGVVVASEFATSDLVPALYVPVSVGARF